MPNIINWQQVAAAFVEAMAGTVDGAADLKNKLDQDAALSAAVENTNGHQWVRFVFRCKMQVSATNGFFNLWIIEGHDIGAGVAYEDAAGGTSPTIPARSPDVSLPILTGTAQQVIAVPGIFLRCPEDFKILVENRTGQSCSNTDNENELWYQLYDEEIQ